MCSPALKGGSCIRFEVILKAPTSVSRRPRWCISLDVATYQAMKDGTDLKVLVVSANGRQEQHLPDCERLNFRVYNIQQR